MDRSKMAPGNELDAERYVTVTTKPHPSHSSLAASPAGVRPSNGGMAGIFEQAPERAETPQWQMSRIAIKYKRRVFFISPSDVLSVVAQGNYVVLEEESGSYRLLESISAIAEKLRPYGFIRIHRSRVVNCSCVEKLRTCAGGGYLVCLRGGKEYAVTKSYKKNLKSLAGVWLGKTESEKW